MLPSLTASQLFVHQAQWWTKYKSRKENPQKLTQLSSRSHPRHLVGKRTAQKDITIDTTSDSQVNSNFPNRWSPASLTFNDYFYLFLYLYITWITTNNNAPHLKSQKNQSRRAALGRPAIKITVGLQLVFGKASYFSWLDSVLSVTWSFGVQLVVFFFSYISVVLLDTIQISRCHKIRCFCRVLNFDSSKVLSVICFFPVLIPGLVTKPSCGPCVSNRCRRTERGTGSSKTSLSLGQTVRILATINTIVIVVEESWSVVKDRVGPWQFWSCSKQSWSYGDLPRRFSS